MCEFEREWVGLLYSFLRDEELDWGALEYIIEKLPRRPAFRTMKNATNQEELEFAVHSYRARGGPIPQNLVWDSMLIVGIDPWPWMKKEQPDDGA